MKTIFLKLLKIALISCWGVEPIIRSYTFSYMHFFGLKTHIYYYVASLLEVMVFFWAYLPLYIVALSLLHLLCNRINAQHLFLRIKVFTMGLLISQIPCVIAFYQHYSHGWLFDWKQYGKYGLTYLITGTVATWLYYLWIFKPIKKGIIQA